MNLITIILLSFMIGIFYVPIRYKIISWWKDRNAKKEFDKRQEHYRKMI